ALVDGREVVQHLVRPSYFFPEKTEQRRHPVFVCPECGDAVGGVLRGHRRRTERAGDLLRKWRVCTHTSSGSLSTVVFLRLGRNRSRMDGSGACRVSCAPTTQLSGRRSLPTAFCNNSRPSRKASGRGGQPGT